MRTRKENYQNQRTKEIKEFDADVDGNNHIPMYQYADGDEWRAVPKWKLNVVNSQFFFESAHNNIIKTTKPPLDGSDFPYGVT
jgi:hypothetical protein